MILDILLSMGPGQVIARLVKNVNVALNSSKHMKSLIEDALDLFRIENN